MANSLGVGIVGALLGAGLIGALVVAGPLDPPSGPVSSTYKTLGDVEPRVAVNGTNTPGDADSVFKITQPGSYYLTGDIVGQSAKHGIEIASSLVTLDLNGFRVVGTAGSKSGIVAGIAENTTVRNGTVHGWGDSGVSLLTSARSCVEDVSSVGNTQFGIAVGLTSTVRRCNVANNGNGIRGGFWCVISECQVRESGSMGIFCEGQAIVSSCLVQGSGAVGVHASGYGNLVSDCTVSDSSSAGILAESASRVVNCQSNFNQGDGIQCPGNGSTVENCGATLNSGNGISVGSDCTVRLNNCRENGFNDGAGILVAGTNNRIEENNCLWADRGVHVTGTGNFIVRNTCSQNTADWVFAANNVYGPIRDRRAPGSPAINSFDAPGSLGTAEANANFSY